MLTRKDIIDYLIEAITLIRKEDHHNKYVYKGPYKEGKTDACADAEVYADMILKELEKHLYMADRRGLK